MSQDFSVLLHTPTDGTDGDCTASLKNPRGIEPRRILPQPRGSQAHTCMSPQSSDCLTFIHNLKPSDPSIFFRTPQSSGARYKRIPKRPRVTPSPQLYAIKREKLQELENLSNQGLIDLYFGDESHVCTQGYVPYGWQFPGENVFVPSMKSARLNIFGMIRRDNAYHGFTSRQSIKAEDVADFIDTFSLTITRPTFIVLDNASVHTGGKMKEMVEKWRQRGLYIFYLPPYSPHLNIAETLWRILKTKWIKPCHYIDTSTLFNATHEILDGIGEGYRVNYSIVA